MRGVEWEELDQDYWEEQDNHDIQLLGESEPFFWGNPDDSLRKVINQHRNAMQLLTRLTLWLALSCAQVWLLLLARAAGDASVSDGALHRMIKDATDNVEFDANSFDSCLREELDNENLVLSLKCDSSLPPSACCACFLPVVANLRRLPMRAKSELYIIIARRDGAERMTRLAKDKEAWSKLPSTKKHHKARRLIDRYGMACAIREQIQADIASGEQAF